MAPSARSTRYHAERGLARHIAQRSSLLESDTFPSQSPTPEPASPSPSQAGSAGVTLPPHGVAALIGTVVMLSLLILGLAAWKIWVYRRKKVAAGLPAWERPSRTAGLFDAIDEETKFGRTLSGSSSSTLFIPPLTGPKAVLTRERSAAEVKVNLGYQPKVIFVASQEKPNFKVTPPGITVTPAPPTLQISPPPVYADIPVPKVSPRTAASKTPDPQHPPAKSSKLPRLVVVETTFTQTLHDELLIREGETLRLLEEYEDEWCLVQRVGPKNAEKGVVPRFCVIDKPEVVPSKKSTHVPRFSSSTKL